MKAADNLDRHNILHEFEFRQDRTIYFGVTCPSVPKAPIFDFVRSMCNFYPILMKLVDKWDRCQIFDKLETRPQCIIYFRVNTLDCWQVGSQVNDCYPLGLFVILRNYRKLILVH